MNIETISQRGLLPDRIAVLMLAVLAIGLHLWFAFTAKAVLTGDMVEYHAIAMHLLQQGYFGIGQHPDAYVTPGYPLFVALSYLAIHVATGIPLTSATAMLRAFYVWQQVITLSIPWLCFMLASEVSNRRAGLAAALLSIAYLPNHFIGSQMLTEALYIPFLLLSLLLLTKAKPGARPGFAAATGFVVGVTVLIRPTAAVLFPVWFLLHLASGRSARHPWPRSLLMALLLSLGIALATLPWVVRNGIVLHRFIPLSTEAGNPLLLGASPYLKVGQYQLLALAQRSHQGLQQFAVHYIQHGFSTHFWLFLAWYTVIRIAYYFFSPWLLWWWANTRPFVLFHQCLCWCGLLATGYACFQPRLRLVGLVVVALLAAQWPFLPLPRYVYPIVAVWCALVPAAAQTLWHKRRYIRAAHEASGSFTS